MPRGPKGEKRPADTNSCAVMVARIATEGIEDVLPSAWRNGGLKGGKARFAAMTDEERSELGCKATNARWGKQSAAAGGSGVEPQR